MCCRYAFNNLKAQRNSDRKSMSDFCFSCHLNLSLLRVQPFKNTTKFKWEYNVRYFVYLYNNLMCQHCASSNSATMWPGLQLRLLKYIVQVVNGVWDSAHIIISILKVSTDLWHLRAILNMQLSMITWEDIYCYSNLRMWPWMCYWF